ncbi:restriction endonuclease subunit S [Pseudomonas sp. PSB11]|uniref:restriction endonuclease subunit S n=1 Tax=Pseudomonas sp. PSB11 TaxID=2021969 RepID=UPI0016602D60|nr:restriction endonuclease subunit S [Pseudomonas sp. PSB11]MBD0677159.1 type I restriction endonuclease [Pseudomonas sp. PSB11]
MTALLTENLPLLAGAPNGIKKLRELILELAVRGKLVPQNPSDEPASELLKRITEEKARLVAEGKLKKQKPLAKIAEEEKPFAMPANWEWVRLDALLKKIGAGSTPLGGKQAYVADGVKFLRSQNIWNEGLRLNEVAFIPEETHQKMSGTRVEAGDLLFNITGASIGRCAAVPTDFDTGNVSQHVTIIRPVSGETQPFLHVVLVSQLVQQTVMDVQVGVSREGLSIGKLAQFLIPFPPVAEQRRIVAKVDELMALCDRLEAQQAGAESAHARLIQALLDSLTEARDATDFATSWLRLAEHFHTLFTTESSVDALKQNLLQMAVMGKLVAQDPSDEPASRLLAKLQEARSRLVDAGSIKQDKPLPTVSDDEKPYRLPNGWEWARMQSAIDVRDGTHDSPKQAFGENTYPLVTSKDFYNGSINFEGAKRISQGDYIEIAKRSYVEKFDILFSMIGGNIGNQIMVNTDVEFGIKNVALFKYYDKNLTYPPFIKLITENIALDLQGTATGGAQPFVALGTLRKLVIAIPPVSEQRRIVIKVDQLMALCNQLKNRLTQARQLNEQLACTLVEQAVA